MSTKTTKTLADLTNLELNDLLQAMGDAVAAVAVARGVQPFSFAVVAFNDPAAPQYALKARSTDAAAALRAAAEGIERR